MPLNAKGKKILANMKKEYGEKKGKQVFYASENKGSLHGIKRAADGAVVSPDYGRDAHNELAGAYSELSSKTL